LTRKDSSNGFAVVAIIFGEIALVGAQCSRQLRRGLRARKDAPTLQNLRRKMREISGHDCPVDRAKAASTKTAASACVSAGRALIAA
jgi:hypothetical protein